MKEVNTNELRETAVPACHSAAPCYAAPVLPVDPSSDSEIEGYFDRHHKRVKTKCDLIYVAAALLQARLSDFREDYPKSMPVSVLMEIEKHNEKLRLMAIEVRRISDSA